MAVKKKKKKPEERVLKNHTVYFHSLNYLIDKLFTEAFRQKLSWGELSDKSGLSVSTIMNLASRKTRYPAYRTVQLLAHGLGGKVVFSTGHVGRRTKVAWALKLFSGRQAA